jgi:hypothetical protein
VTRISILIVVSIVLTTFGGAADSDFLYDAWTISEGRIVDSGQQKLRYWIDLRSLRKDGVLGILLSNEGPGDMFVSKHTFWYARAPQDGRMADRSGPSPGVFSLLPSAQGKKRLVSTTIMDVSPMNKDQQFGLKDGYNIVIRLNTIDRTSGISKAVELVLEAQ